jgi:hypothetical protein
LAPQINFKSPPPDSLAFEANGLLILQTPYAKHSQTLLGAAQLTPPRACRISCRAESPLKNEKQADATRAKW